MLPTAAISFYFIIYNVNSLPSISDHEIAAFAFWRAPYLVVVCACPTPVTHVEVGDAEVPACGTVAVFDRVLFRFQFESGSVAGVPPHGEAAPSTKQRDQKVLKMAASYPPLTRVTH